MSALSYFSPRFPELCKKPKTTSKVLEKPAVLSYEELGGLSDPGPRGCAHNVV
jgi:hypothetical protein